MDKELFDLCKQVYEKTRWDEQPSAKLYLEKYYYNDKDNLTNAVVEKYKTLYEQFVCPVYSSDYLLDKLPTKLKDKNQVITAWLSMDNLGDDGWQYSYRPGPATPILKALSDTPLKALLLLTLALSEAGEL